MSKTVVMIVDDNPGDQHLAKLVFEDQPDVGEILVAPEGASALVQLDERWRHGLPLPSIILLDLKMPKMDGFEFLDAFESQHPRSAAIYVVTGSASDPDRMRALSYESVQDYIVKPVMGSDIVRVLMVAHRSAGQRTNAHSNAAGSM